MNKGCQEIIILLFQSWGRPICYDNSNYVELNNGVWYTLKFNLTFEAPIAHEEIYLNCF